MSSIESQIKVLCLCLLTSCVVGASIAGGAQGNWLENGSEVTANKNVLAKADTAFELEFPALGFEFRCSALKAENFKLLSKSEKAEGNIALSGCGTYSPAGLKGTEQTKCKPSEPLVFGATALLILLESEKEVKTNYILFVLNSTIALPEACPLFETAKLTGGFTAECGILNPVNTFAPEDCSTARVEHLIRPVVGKLYEKEVIIVKKEVAKDSVKLGANSGNVGGIVALELESKGSWSGHV